MENNENKKQKKHLHLLLVLVCLLVLIIGGSFAWLGLKINGSKTNILKAGYLSLVLDESETEGINIEKAIPTSDTTGLTQEGYTFKLVNNGKTAANYTIYLDDLDLEENETRMPDSVVKYNLTKNGVEGSTVLLPSIGTNPKRIVDTGTIDANTTNTYTLKLWMDYEATIDVMNTVFFAQLRVEAEQENIKVEESDMTIDIADTTQKLDLGEDISNFTIESSDPTIATIDSEGNIITNGYGTVTFTTQNKTTGAKKNITVTITKTLTATYIKQVGVDSIERETDTCKLSDKNETTCSVTLPSITASNGYSVIGWSKDNTSHTGVVTTMDISEDTNIYTIMQKDAITYTATFNKPSVGVSAIGNTTLSCTIPAVYNDEVQATSCNITLPTITTLDGYTAIGWNELENATTGTVPNTEIEISSNKNFFAIVKKDAITLSAKFYKNGAISQDNNTDEFITKSCVLEEKYNGEEQAIECSITTPTIEASTATPIVVGYAENKDATEASVQPNTSLTLSSNKTYYVITKSSVKTYTATFNRNGAASQTVSGGSASTADNVTQSCNIPVTYNGTSQASSCSVTTPSITASTATPTVCGYTTTSTGTSTCSVKENTEISLSSNIDYYAQTYKAATSKTATFKIASTTAVSKIANSTENVTNTTESLKETCETIDLYNGDTDSKGSNCSITSPTITAATGYKNPFWGTSTTATSGSASGASWTISEATTYYANASITSQTVTYDATTNGGTTSATTKTVNYNSAIDLTPTASKTGYTFKGWNTTKTATTGLSSLKMGTSDVTLYAIFVDETAPKCSWSTSSEIELNSAATLILTCEDTGSGITSAPTLATSDFTVTAKGSITSVSGPTVVTASKKYSYIVSIKGIHAGTFTVTLPANKVSDGAGNKNAATTSSAVTVKSGTTSPTVNMSGYTYGGTKSTPTISGNTSGGTVTYYYNTTDSNSGGTAWTNVTSATSLNAGTYYMYAVVAATDDYNAVTTEPVEFKIAQAPGNVSLSATSGTITYGTSSTTFTVTGNTSSGTLSVSDDNSTATSSISGNTVTIGSLGSINAGTSIKVTVTSATTTNYKAASASYTLTINKADISPTVSMSGYTFAGTKSTPSISGNTGSGTVTYYYNTSNSNSNGIAWSNVTSSSSLAVGTYYMYATVKTTDNYNAATTQPVAFTISGITRSATFYSNGNTLSTPSGCTASGTNRVCSCRTTGTSTSCSVTAPTITAPTNTPTIIGFSTGSTNRTKSVASGASVTLSSNPSYYAQTTKAAITYTATYTKDTTTVSAIGATSNSCTIAATYNGTAQATSCTVTLPTITAADGYIPSGWFLESNATNTPDIVVSQDGTASSPYTLSATNTVNNKIKLIAKARKAGADEISFDATTTGYSCTDVQCALDELNKEF